MKHAECVSSSLQFVIVLGVGAKISNFVLESIISNHVSSLDQREQHDLNRIHTNSVGRVAIGTAAAGQRRLRPNRELI